MAKPGITVLPNQWRTLIDQLYRRGQARHEAGAFLLGASNAGHRQMSAVVYYDDLDPRAYDTGVCVLRAGAFAALWQHCRDKRLTVVADIHTHPFGAGQSLIDRRNPMVARAGHTALIVPNYAAAPIKFNELGVYVYQGNYCWSNQSPHTGSTFLAI